MSYYSRSKTIVESLLDKSYTDEDFISLIDTITNYTEAQGLTDEQKCQGFITLWAGQLQRIVRVRAEDEVKKAAEIAAKQAGDDAVANL